MVSYACIDFVAVFGFPPWNCMVWYWWNSQRLTGCPRQTGHTWLFGEAPYSFLHRQKAFVCVLSCMWHSIPITASYFLCRKDVWDCDKLWDCGITSLSVTVFEVLVRVLGMCKAQALRILPRPFRVHLCEHTEFVQSWSLLTHCKFIYVLSTQIQYILQGLATYVSFHTYSEKPCHMISTWYREELVSPSGSWQLASLQRHCWLSHVYSISDSLCFPSWRRMGDASSCIMRQRTFHPP